MAFWNKPKHKPDDDHHHEDQFWCVCVCVCVIKYEKQVDFESCPANYLQSRMVCGPCADHFFSWLNSMVHVLVTIKRQTNGS